MGAAADLTAQRKDHERGEENTGETDVSEQFSHGRNIAKHMPHPLTRGAGLVYLVSNCPAGVPRGTRGTRTKGSAPCAIPRIL